VKRGTARRRSAYKGGIIAKRRRPRGWWQHPVSLGWFFGEAGRYWRSS
jgi:hypothetical protein